MKDFDELAFFARLKERPGMYFGRPSLRSMADLIVGMDYAFCLCGKENQFPLFKAFIDWYHKEVIRDQNGYACWWNHLIYVSGGEDREAFAGFFRVFERYLKDIHAKTLPKAEVNNAP